MKKRWGYCLLLVAALVAPTVLYPVLLMKILCFALFACSFNLLVGYAGLLSFGHAAFFGAAGYVAGYALKSWGVSTEAGLALGTLTGALIGLVMGALAIRRQGIYFTMITLALAQMLYFVFLQAPFAGGEDGLQGIPRGRLFGVLDLSNDLALYFVVLAISVGAFALIMRTIHSPFGEVLRAIRENEPRAISLGYQVDRYKMLAFVLSAALSGLAGAMKAMVLGFETLTDAHWSMSGLVVLMTLVGGLGTLFGPIVGALIIVMLEDKLGDIGNWLASVTGVNWFGTLGDSVTIVTGFIFIVCVLALRKGIVGEILALFQRIETARQREKFPRRRSDHAHQ
ncbi:MAG: transporter permease [Caballeronia sp.]|jgi:branched-chain amino acid transport system permease protein|uniref:branched-chain amino acid ABC transporter permease n=1 Tax=Caballeronia sp. TaxID=1931223 RepID=UPI00262B86F2|nr:branched-chain amino acid ABC transporter permease [Caballeronia sp.]MDB5831047.1 transporter permease [Caballeronia sp.]